MIGLPDTIHIYQTSVVTPAVAIIDPETGDFIDVWGLLGLPLIVMLSVPSGPLGDSPRGPTAPGGPLLTPVGAIPGTRVGVGEQRPSTGRDGDGSKQGDKGGGCGQDYFLVNPRFNQGGILAQRSAEK